MGSTTMDHRSWRRHLRNSHRSTYDTACCAKKKRKYPGTNRLKDTFAATIPRNYDLQAPDHSYLLITELRDFYRTKASIFTESKNITAAIQQTLHDFYSTTETHISDVSTYIQPSQTAATLNMLPHNHAFLNSLKNVVQSTNTSLADLNQLASSLLKHIDPPLDLEAFKDGPPSTEIPVPPTYADCLKVIFNTVVEKIHRTKPLVETLKRQENRFETYITIGNFTSRYYGDHEKTATAMEAAAIYYSLKHITNVGIQDS